MTDKTKRDDTIEKHATSAVKLAADIASDARNQLAGYRSRIEGVANEIGGAARRMGAPRAEEKALMDTSAKLGASLTEVALDFAEAAFKAMKTSSTDTRRRATDLVREVVKLAVDETLDQTNRAASRTTRMIELRTDKSWETIYLPRIEGKGPKITLQLKGGEFAASLQVRTGPDQSATLVPKGQGKSTDKDTADLELTGSRPSLSIRLDPAAQVPEPQSGLILITGGANLTLGLLALAYVPPEDNDNGKP